MLLLFLCKVVIPPFYGIGSSSKVVMAGLLWSFQHCTLLSYVYDYNRYSSGYAKNWFRVYMVGFSWSLFQVMNNDMMAWYPYGVTDRSLVGFMRLYPLDLVYTYILAFFSLVVLKSSYLMELDTCCILIRYSRSIILPMYVQNYIRVDVRWTFFYLVTWSSQVCPRWY